MPRTIVARQHHDAPRLSSRRILVTRLVQFGRAASSLSGRKPAQQLSEEATAQSRGRLRQSVACSAETEQRLLCTHRTCALRFETWFFRFRSTSDWFAGVALLVLRFHPRLFVNCWSNVVQKFARHR